MAARDIPPNKLDLPSDESANQIEDGAKGEAGSSAPVDDAKAAAAVPTMGAMMNPLPENAPRSHAELKRELMKEVRRFGRKYERLFLLLEGVQGPLEVKRQFVEFTIKEAARFKRRNLISHLEKFLKNLESEQHMEKEESAESP